MVTLDKIKILTSLDYISNIRFTGNKYEIKSPFHFYMGVDYTAHNATILFSGKILLDDYPRLINRETIRTCFERINDLGVCRLDIDNIINHSIVLLADFTKDVRLADMEGINTFDDLKTVAKLSIKNYQQWNYLRYKGNGLEVSNNVSTPTCKRRIIFYDKSHQLTLKSQRDFLNAVRDRQRILDYFNGRIRFEVNARTLKQIREWLNIPNTSLISVLNAESNPIKNVMSMMFHPINFTDSTISSRDRERIDRLKLYDWDLRAIEPIIREDNRNISRTMGYYRRLCAIHAGHTNVDITSFAD